MNEVTELTSRRLAAIMFADIEGYSRMIQQDEELGKRKREEFTDILKEKSRQFGGSIVQFYGDGALVLFDSVVDAVSCSIHLQKDLIHKNKVPVRVGIHTGDIIVDQDIVIGDSVNMASRIESMAVAGSILISGKVYDELKNQTKFKLSHLGYFDLKNISGETELLAVANEGLVIPKASELKGKGKAVKQSIAVLPFMNMSNDSENEYFSDGITEEILNVLARIDSLQVTARTSSFAFKGKNEDIREIGKKLGVAYVLEGSVRKAGNRVRVTAQLINVEDGYHLWSENFDRELKDIFEVQDEISGKIADQLLSKLSLKHHKEETKSLDIAAYNLFLKGRFEFNKWSPETTKIAIEHFEEVIKIAPYFSPAYSSLANCYSFLGAMGQMLPKAAFPKMAEYNKKALKLDNSSDEAWASRALAEFIYDWDFERANASFLHAFSLNNSNADTHQFYAFFKLMTGEEEQALFHANEALLLDPLSMKINVTMGDVLFFSNRLEEAIMQYEKAHEMDPSYRDVYQGLGWAYYFSGNHSKARKIFLELELITPGKNAGIVHIACYYAVTGNKEKVKFYLDLLHKRQEEEKGITLAVDFLLLYVANNELDRAFEYLELCFQQRLVAFLFIEKSPLLTEMKKDTRYKELLIKYGVYSKQLHS